MIAIRKRILVGTSLVLLTFATGCGDSHAVYIGNVSFTETGTADGDEQLSGGSARIVEPTDSLPLTVAVATDVGIQDNDTGAHSVPESVESFRLATAAGAPCRVTDVGSCSGNRCSGEFVHDAWGICYVGFIAKTPETSESVTCWEHSIVDSDNVSDEAFHAANDAALTACLDLVD